MANKKSSSKPASKRAQTSKSSGRIRAASPADKAKSAKPSQQEAAQAVAKPPLLDENMRRGLTALICIIAAIALVLIVAWPTNAVVASFMSRALRLAFGVGAYMLPLLLVVIATTTVMRFQNDRLPARFVLGLCITFVGFLILMALFTPNGVAADGAVSEMLSENQVVFRGGYVGAGPAWLGVSWLGMPVACVIAAGIMAIGILIVGESVHTLKMITQPKRERESWDEEGGDYEELPGFVPATPSRSKSKPIVSPSAKTILIDDPEPAGNPRLERLSKQLADEHASKAKQASEPKPITRRLGEKAANTIKLDEAEAKPKEELTANATAIGTVSADESFELPDKELIKTSKSKKRSKAAEQELADTAARLQQTMEDFGIMATVVDWIAGPTVTLFEVDLPPGVRVSRLTALNDDIALALAAPGVRIFAPIPGTHYVGIEVPNATRENVLLGDVLKEVKGGPLEMAIGKDVEGNAIVCDLAKMPHLLIGGTTGSGKSVGINAMIMSMLMRATPSQVRFIMIDPKRVEFTPYNGIPHLYVPVVTEPKEAASALSWGVAEMERRLKVFSKFGARNIAQYNEKVRNGDVEQDGGPVTEELPYIVIIIDELADLMMNVGKEVEFSIARIAQLARAAGIHLIVATQRPSANVVTGLIKANITNRIAFNVASGLDSRVILDVSGAESLIGNGDLLLSKPEYAKPVRIQGCFVSPEEIEAVVEAVKSQGEPEYHSEILKTNLISLGDTMPDGSGGSGGGGDDPLIWEAAEIVVASGLGSTSNIQRKLKVGYSRAGRIMDMLEEKGVVGPPNGSKPRDVLVDAMELETLKAFEQADE